VQRLRARASAILTGVGTVLADDPRLDVRLAGATRQPLRVVLDPRLETPPAARILQSPGKVLILASTGALSGADRLQAAGAAIECLPGEPDALDLEAVLARLAALEVNEVHAECGATLAGALLAASLVDELVVYLAPVLLGEDARPLAVIGELTSMRDTPRLEILSERRVGPDLRLVLRPTAAGSP
jgi:diaminohydroxyphosphoribosylaminopyrimidine deaminase/5-amino-6-(5-phosphoribosylamino)uracil reductase